MSERLTDEELTDALTMLDADHVRPGAYDIRLMIAELRERRAADDAQFSAAVAVFADDDGKIHRVFLSGREREALQFARERMERALNPVKDDGCPCGGCTQYRAAIAVLDKLLAQRGGG